MKYRQGSDQIEIVEGDKSLKIVISKVRIVDAKVVKKMEIPLFHKPIDLSRLKKEDVDFVLYLLKLIITRKYPTPPQLELGYSMAVYPDSILTQGLLKYCYESKCFCPLFFSVGCPEFIEEDIKPKSGDYIHTSATSINKKCIKTALHALRRFLSPEEVDTLADKLTYEERVIEE